MIINNLVPTHDDQYMYSLTGNLPVDETQLLGYDNNKSGGCTPVLPMKTRQAIKDAISNRPKVNVFADFEAYQAESTLDHAG